MSLIEKAVERLDQLKKAGLSLPESAPTPERSAKPVVEAAPAQVVAPAVMQSSASVQTESVQVAEPVVVSRSIEIDIERLDGLGMVTSMRPRSVIAEEYRVVKRPLLKNVLGRSGSAIHTPNLIMVTSSVPGEGKSFSAINLALSIAMELDHRVLLVDADVARPSVLNQLGLPPEKGLMDVLLSNGEMDLSDVMLRTNIEKLSLLPAGTPHARATEFLASDAMTQLVEDLASRYSDRIVIFDSPPLLPTTEARVLATHMGQIVMVVEAGKTTQGMVKQALGTIEACPIKMMLLNKMRDASAGGYYGYHYGNYGYGSSA